MKEKDPIRPANDEARALAWRLVDAACYGALAVIDPATGGPIVTRVAVGWADGGALILVSTLSAHTSALAANPACSLLVGEVGERGDPLTHPRLTLQARAALTDKAAGRMVWLRDHPKAALYYDFTDFKLLRLTVEAAFLNGGFGRAWRLTPEDLTGISPTPRTAPTP